MAKYLVFNFETFLQNPYYFTKSVLNIKNIFFAVEILSFILYNIDIINGGILTDEI